MKHETLNVKHETKHETFNMKQASHTKAHQTYVSVSWIAKAYNFHVLVLSMRRNVKHET